MKTGNGISSMGTVRTFLKVGTCSETLCNVLDRAFDHHMELEEHAAMPLAGGIQQQGYLCGLIWGAALAAGAQAYRLHGPGPQAEAEAVRASQRLMESFRARHTHINCLELTETEWKNSMQVAKYFIKGGTIRCFRMAGRFAQAAFDETTAVFSEDHPEAPAPPVSCAALLAKNMGASDMHAAMAAGFAGGIGLYGGACGALAAAIWILALKGDNISYNDPRAQDVIERFLKSTDFEFECSKIVGRKFENIDDHAAYLRDGGCSNVLEALATA